MVGQIVEITKSGQSLKKTYGFLDVYAGQDRAGRVPLDDIITVVISVPGCSISTVLINELCKRNIPLVICGANFLPCSFTLPVTGYSRQFQVMHTQINLTRPQKKRAWQKIVRAKISNQAKVLSNVGEDSAQLERLAKNVQSGDKGNLEAQAARYYWQKLFGRQFRRKQNAPGLNSALNYAYTVVRACTARGIVAAGLHPTFSIHHRNPTNAFNLVDDFVEPFRPIVDYMIWRIGENSMKELNSDMKLKLASITALKIPMKLGKDVTDESPMSLATIKICRSFANYCDGRSRDFLVPELPTPKDYLEL